MGVRGPPFIAAGVGEFVRHIHLPSPALSQSAPKGPAANWMAAVKSGAEFPEVLGGGEGRVGVTPPPPSIPTLSLLRPRAASGDQVKFCPGPTRHVSPGTWERESCFLATRQALQSSRSRRTFLLAKRPALLLLGRSLGQRSPAGVWACSLAAVEAALPFLEAAALAPTTPKGEGDPGGGEEPPRALLFPSPPPRPLQSLAAAALGQKIKII